MSILASIKAEKKLSFNHWRYRILHWCFNEDAETPKDSKLPGFLYTHYCPLFHLTNLIAVLFPLILFMKIVAAVFVGIGRLFMMVPWEKLEKFINWCLDLIPKPKPKPEKAVKFQAQSAQWQLKQDKRRLLARMLSNERYDESEFLPFWHAISHDFEVLTEEEAKEFYNSRMRKIIDTRARVKERKEKMRQRLIFWTNFSHVFLKWFFNICYLAMAVGVGYLLYLFVPPFVSAVIWFCKFMVTVDFVPILKFIFRLTMWTVAALLPSAIVIWAFWRFRVLRLCAGVIGASVRGIAPPFVLLFQWFCLPFIWGAHLVESAVEFMRMFYEENCPPIIIVSEDDETIAQELGDMEP